MGIPIPGPTRILVDIATVVQSSIEFTPPLNKEHVSIAYHRCRENVTVGAVSFAHIDLLTKALNGATIKRLLEEFGDVPGCPNDLLLETNHRLRFLRHHTYY